MLSGSYAKEKFDARAIELHELILLYVLGGAGGDVESVPYSQLTEPSVFMLSLTDSRRIMNGVFARPADW